VTAEDGLKNPETPDHGLKSRKGLGHELRFAVMGDEQGFESLLNELRKFFMREGGQFRKRFLH
jgi:hypothetical protein